MTRHEFRNLLCALRFIDMAELSRHGIVSSIEEWQAFRDNPGLFFLMADHDQSERLWSVMQRKQEGSQDARRHD